MVAEHNAELWNTVWEECFDEAKERTPEYDPEDYYKSGRASKAWPEGETPEWWHENGPKFVDQWEVWRDNSTLSFSEVCNPDTGEIIPAIELPTWAYNEDLILQSVIDRVMQDENGNHYIIDLKTGSMTDAWPRQMALNNLGLIENYGIRARWAGFWSARKGTVPHWFDLSIFPDEWLWDQVRKAKAIRDQQLFVAQPNNLCSRACGVKPYCLAMGGELAPPFDPNATLAQTH